MGTYHTSLKNTVFHLYPHKKITGFSRPLVALQGEAATALDSFSHTTDELGLSGVLGGLPLGVPAEPVDPGEFMAMAIQPLVKNWGVFGD